MSNEALRAVALSEAVKTVAQSGSASAVLTCAKTYLEFLTGAPSVGAEAPKPAPKATTKAVKLTPPFEDQPEAEKAEKAEKPEKPTVSKEQVGKVVSNLLAANKRPQAVALLKKFGATSVSKVSESDYAAFVSEGNAELDDISF